MKAILVVVLIVIMFLGLELGDRSLPEGTVIITFIDGGELRCPSEMLSNGYSQGMYFPPESANARRGSYPASCDQEYETCLINHVKLVADVQLLPRPPLPIFGNRIPRSYRYEIGLKCAETIIPVSLEGCEKE